MSDLCRFGLPLAALIAAAATCLFLLLAPSAHTPRQDQMTGQVRINETVTVPHIVTGEAVTTNA